MTEVYSPINIDPSPANGWLTGQEKPLLQGEEDLCKSDHLTCTIADDLLIVEFDDNASFDLFAFKDKYGVFGCFIDLFPPRNITSAELNPGTTLTIPLTSVDSKAPDQSQIEINSICGDDPNISMSVRELIDLFESNLIIDETSQPVDQTLFTDATETPQAIKETDTSSNTIGELSSTQSLDTNPDVNLIDQIEASFEQYPVISTIGAGVSITGILFFIALAISNARYVRRRDS